MALRDLLLQPGVVEEAVREFQALAAGRRREGHIARAKQEMELSEVRRRATRLVDQVAEGVLGGAAVKERLDALEARRYVLERELAEEPAKPELVLQPSGPVRFRQLVEQLNAVVALEDTIERRAAREGLRADPQSGCDANGGARALRSERRIRNRRPPLGERP